MSNTSTRHITLIDDDSDDFSVLCYIVEEINVDARITAITDTESIVEKLKRDLPDLIFLDLAMSRKSGYDCLVEINRCAELNDIPVVVYSDCTNAEEIHRAIQLGARKFIQKPSSYSEFVQTMEKTLLLDLKFPQLRKKYQPPTYEKLAETDEQFA